MPLRLIGRRSSDPHVELSPCSVELPLDVQHRIIDRCSEGWTGYIRDFSLVSKAWQRRAQQHLLSIVYIYSNDHKGFTRSPRAFVAFIDGRPDLKPFIHDVYIKPGTYGSLAAAVVAVPEVRAVLSRLPQVHEVHILATNILPWSRISSRPGSLGPECEEPALPAKVDILRMRTSQIRDEDLLSNLLGLFSSIDKLYVENVQVIPAIQLNESTGRSPPPTPPRVRALDIKKINSDFLRYLMQDISASELEALRAEEGRLDDCQFCITAAPNLKALQVDVPIMPPDIVLFSLRACPKLEALTLAFYPSGTDRVHLDNSWIHVVFFLSTLPNPAILTCLRLVLIAIMPLRGKGPFVQITDEHWDSFVDALARFDNLTQLDINVVQSYGDETGWEHHPGIINFFEKSKDDLFPKERKYSVNIAFSDYPQQQNQLPMA